MNKVFAAIAVTAVSLAAASAFAESAADDSRRQIHALWNGTPTYEGANLAATAPRFSTGTDLSRARSTHRVLSIGEITIGGAETGLIEPNRLFRPGSAVSK